LILAILVLLIHEAVLIQIGVAYRKNVSKINFCIFQPLADQTAGMQFR